MDGIPDEENQKQASKGPANSPDRAVKAKDVANRGNKLPPLERFVEVATGDSKWSAAEMELRAKSEEFQVSEAVAHVQLAPLQGSESASIGQLRAAAKIILELQRPAVMEAATRYAAAMCPNDTWESRFRKILEQTRAADETPATNPKVDRPSGEFTKRVTDSRGADERPPHVS